METCKMILSCVTFFLLCAVSGLTADNAYDDCPFSPLCADRNPDYLYQPDGTTYIPREPCRCDGECHLHDDCCPDAPDHIYSSVELKILGGAPGGEPWACQPLLPPVIDPNQMKVSMVNWCPSRTNSLLDAKCRKDTTTESYNYTYLIDVPVISSNSGIIYQNIFCGKCHREYYFTQYEYSIYCDCDIDSTKAVMNMTYQPGNLTWTAPRSNDIRCLDPETVTCSLTVGYPENLGRVCEEFVIESCTEGAVGRYKEVENMCLNGDNYYIQDSKGNVYKNKYCLLCNGVALSDSQCLQPYDISSGTIQRTDLWTVSDLFDFDQDCDLNYYVPEPIFGQCDLFEKLPDYFASNDTNLGTYLNESIHANSDSPPSPESIVFTVFMSISIVCLLLHIIIFLILYDERKLHSLNLFSMTCALFIAEIFFVFGANLCHTYSGCYFLSTVVYYFFMAAFFWMNVISFDICKTFNSKGVRSHALRSFAKYSVYAWGIPGLMLLCALTVDITAGESTVAPAFGDHGFWFGTLGGLLLFFVIPVELLFLVNTIMLIISANEIRKQKKIGKVAVASSTKVKRKKRKELEAKEKEERKIYHLITGKVKKTIEQHKDDIAKLKLDASLAVLMGVPWIFGVLENFSVVFDYLFSILISLQGVFIFLAFDCKKTVWRDVKAKLQGRQSEDSKSSSRRPTQSTSSTRTNSSTGSRGTHRTKQHRGESNVSKATVDTTVSFESEHPVGNFPSINTRVEALEPEEPESSAIQNVRLEMSSVRCSSSGSHHGIIGTNTSDTFRSDLYNDTVPTRAYSEELSDHENEAIDLLEHRKHLPQVQKVGDSISSSDLDINDRQQTQQQQSPAVPSQRNRKQKKKKRREYTESATRRGKSGSRNHSLRKALSSNSSDEDIVDV